MKFLVDNRHSSVHYWRCEEKASHPSSYFDGGQGGTLKDFWEVRSEYIKTDLPCGTGVEVRRLAFDDLMVEVEAIAVVRGK